MISIIELSKYLLDINQISSVILVIDFTIGITQSTKHR